MPSFGCHLTRIRASGLLTGTLHWQAGTPDRYLAGRTLACSTRHVEKAQDNKISDEKGEIMPDLEKKTLPNGTRSEDKKSKI